MWYSVSQEDSIQGTVQMGLDTGLFSMPGNLQNISIAFRKLY